jgi:hypothetical protein
MIRAPRPIVACIGVLLLLAVHVGAHSGPPYPIVSGRVLGAYNISIWTDPDTTDEGTPAGRFWIEIASADGKTAIPAGTQAAVSIRPLDREGPTHDGRAEPVKGNVARQFVALLMDHEGPFAVHAAIDGPLGRVAVDSKVDATYDLRPAPWLIALYLFPFVAIGALWGKVLLRRRRRG